MSANAHNPYSHLLTLAEVQGLSDDEFRKALIPNLWEDDRFAVFLEVEVVDQAYDVLKEMSIWTAARIGEHPKRSIERREWAIKHEQMGLRLSQLKAEIKRLNIEENESIDAKLRRLGRFAFELASALEAAGAARVLDAIKVDEDCTGAEFLANYRAKLASRESVGA